MIYSNQEKINNKHSRQTNINLSTHIHMRVKIVHQCLVSYKSTQGLNKMASQKPLKVR